jgi:hypothetical protein
MISNFGGVLTFSFVRHSLLFLPTRVADSFRLASSRRIAFLPARMSSLPTADLLALDTAGLKSRLSKLRRYL